MKKYALIIILLLFSCSGDNNDTNANDKGSDKDSSENNETELSINSFNLLVDGKEVNFGKNSITRSGDYFVLLASENNTLGNFFLSFHSEGNLGEINYIESITEEPLTSYVSARYFAKSNFDFEVIAITENSISAKFSGKLYVDDENIEEGVPIEISGDFNLSYTRVLPSDNEIRVKATLNTKNWFSTLSSIFNNTYTYYNDTQYRLDFDIDTTNLIVGDYTFDSESTGFNKIHFIEYSSSTELIPSNRYTIRNGIFSIKSAEDVPNGFFVTQKTLEATFSFEATHPETNEVIKVTSGVLKGVILIN